jgi:hypothetical protein
MPTPPHEEEKLRSLRCPFLTSLFTISLTLSTTLFIVSYRAYITWHRTTSHLHRPNDLLLHTIFFVATCAPLCTFLGILVASAYYLRKRLKYGKYDVTMRRKGRGYWIDASDKVDQMKEDEARRINAEIRKKKKDDGSKMKTQSETTGLQQQQSPSKPLSWVPGDESSAAVSSTNRVSFFSSPYGWVAKNEGHGKQPEQGLARSDSVRTCEDDEVMKKGVVDIWLGQSESGGSNKRKGKLGEEMEMEKIRKTA